LLHIAHIGFFLDRQGRTPSQILVDWWPLVDTAEIVARSGARVSVVQACSRTESLMLNGVQYHFVSPEPDQFTISSGGHFARLLRELKADVFHVHGLGFPNDVQRLADLAPDTPILLQDHADKVPSFWRRHVHRRGISAAAGVSFCALQQAVPFSRLGMIPPRTALFEIPECSSRFTPGDQPAARAATGLHGDPAVLWVGHLDTNKDPLTVLAGVSDAARYLPALQLWCCFGSAPLLGDIRHRIDNDPRLEGRVHLLGKQSHGNIEQLMRAADLFVSGSRREGSGCALIEALACGLAPVVTDIPSFHALTHGGKVGALWPCGDARKLSEALLSVAHRPRPEIRAAVRAHFEAEISFEAAGRKWLSAYEKLLQIRCVAKNARIGACSMGSGGMQHE
jgi:glycosyltransferase involved in cell wall biosynthesis